MDVATGGELAVALQSGFPPRRMVFHGNNKSLRELVMAVEAGVGRVVVDSFDEMDRIDRLYARRGIGPVDVLIRITPGVDAHTHEFVATGHDDTKFGFTVSTGAAAQAVRRAKQSPSMRARGVHAHIGSQVFRLESFREGGSDRGQGWPSRSAWRSCSLGGGLGVPYVEGESRRPPSPSGVRRCGRSCRSEGVTGLIMAEPGRAIVASAAMYPVSGGNHQGDRRGSHLPGGGRGDERQSPAGPVRKQLRGLLAKSGVRSSGSGSHSGGQALRERGPSGCLGMGARPYRSGRPHRHSGHRRLRALHGLQLSKGPPPRPVVFVADGQSRLVVRREEYADMFRLEVG